MRLSVSFAYTLPTIIFTFKLVVAPPIDRTIFVYLYRTVTVLVAIAYIGVILPRFTLFRLVEVFTIFARHIRQLVNPFVNCFVNSLVNSLF